jgi:superfamily I DNA/RNA helicase
MPYQFMLPRIVDLTSDQQMALYEEGEFCLEGGPGTGKTVVSLWRHIENWERRGKKSLLLTYTKTLEYYLKHTAKLENADAGRAIDRTFRWTNSPSEYDEIIIDEAQDVSVDKYHIIKKYAKSVCYGADDRQSLYKDGASPEELNSLFNNKPYALEQNFRNSKQILRFVKGVFSGFKINDNEAIDGKKPKLIDTNKSDEKVKEVIKELISEHKTTKNLAILVPSIKMVHKYKEILDSITDRASMYVGDKSGGSISEISNIHVTTFKSSKGLEFHTVILPEFQKYDFMIEKIPILSENDYYVAITRAKEELYILCDWIPRDIPSSTYEKVNF